MKKFLAVIACISAFCTASIASAMPMYTGTTDSIIGEGGNPSTPTSSGYYIWSNDPNRYSWSVRWTGNNDGDPVNYNWYGKVSFENGIDEVDKIQFEATNDVLKSYLDLGIINWKAVAGPVWDGFDFQIDENALVGNVVRFYLGSSLYTDLVASPDHVAGTGIYIGDDRNTPLVQVETMTFKIDGTTITGPVQEFEIPAPVPEPGTIVLLGAGLLGLGIYGRRRAKK